MLAHAVRLGTNSAERLLPEGGYWPDHHPMMGLIGTNSAVFWLVWILWVITWILIIVVLFALARWLWKKGDKGR